MPGPDDAELLRLYLADRNAPCPKCGYNLRAGQAPVCPECGVGLMLHLHPVIKFPATYSWGVTGLAAGLVLGAVGAFVGLARGSAAMLLPVSIALASIPALILWDRVYFRTRRRRPESIVYLAWGAWAGAAGAVAQLVWTILHMF